LIHLLVGLLVILNDTEELLEHLSQMRLRSQVVPLETAGLLGLIFFPIGFVSRLFHLKLSDFLDLVVVDQEHLTLAVVVLQVGFGLGGIGWLLVADEGKGITGGLALVKSDVFDLTIVLEQVSQVIFGVVVGEVLHIQVASFL